MTVLIVVCLSTHLHGVMQIMHAFPSKAVFEIFVGLGLDIYIPTPHYYPFFYSINTSRDEPLSS